MEYSTRLGFAYGLAKEFVADCWNNRNNASRKMLPFAPAIFACGMAGAYLSDHHFNPEDRNPETGKWTFY